MTDGPDNQNDRVRVLAIQIMTPIRDFYIANENLSRNNTRDVLDAIAISAGTVIAGTGEADFCFKYFSKAVAEAIAQLQLKDHVNDTN